MLTIRQAERKDVDSMLELLKQLFLIEKDFIFHADIQRRGLEVLLHSDQGMLLIAQRGSAVAGMVSGQLLVSTAEGGFSLLIEDLVVAPEFQRVGIGKSLLEAIGAWGNQHGAKRMQLLADRNNKQALSFYHRVGWQSTNLVCLRNYHRLQEDKL